MGYIYKYSFLEKVKHSAMCIHIYSIEFRHPLPHNLLHTLLMALPGGLREKARRYRRWQDMHSCILGKHLISFALLEAGYPANLRNLQYTAHGRPYIAQAPDFNITHSGNRVVCVVATSGAVGIDLEAVHAIDIHDFRDQFTSAEWLHIVDATDPIQMFYHYWTAKECLSKADGRGMNIPLAQIDLCNGATVQLEDRSWHLQSLSDFTGYACHLATEDLHSEVVVEEYSAEDMLLLLPQC